MEQQKRFWFETQRVIARLRERKHRVCNRETESNLCENRNMPCRETMPNRRKLIVSNDELTRNTGNDEVNLPPRSVIGCPSRQIKERHPICNQVRKEQHMELCYVAKEN